MSLVDGDQLNAGCTLDRTREQLPAAVIATVDRETKGATILGYASEVEGGKMQYEVETKIDGHTRDLAIARDGSLVEIEEEVAMTSLSADVRSAIEKKANGATVVKVESLTKKGVLVAYEAATLKGSKKGEVQVGPHGETLKHAE